MDFQEFNFQHISLLIQLRYNIYNIRKWDPVTFYDRMADILEALNIDPDITEVLNIDWNLRRELLSRLDAKIQHLQQEYQSTYGELGLDVDPLLVKESLEQGILNLRVTISLSNPFAVLKMEKYFGIDETGDLQLMTRNWNRRYYSSTRCLAYDAGINCIFPAVEYGDVEMFKKLFAEPIHRDFPHSGLAMQAARFGRREIVDIIMADPEAIDENTASMLLAAAAGSPYPNVLMMKYIYDNFGPKHDMHELDIRQSHMVNVQYLIDLGVAKVDKLLPDIAGHGWLEMYKTLLRENLPSQHVLDRSIYCAALNAQDEMVQFLRNYIGIKASTLNELLVHTSRAVDDPEYRTFRYVISLPEVNEAAIRQFLRFIDTTPTSDPTYDIIVESGKMNRLTLEKILAQYRPD